MYCIKISNYEYNLILRYAYLMSVNYELSQTFRRKHFNFISDRNLIKILKELSNTKILMKYN